MLCFLVMFLLCLFSKLCLYWFVLVCIGLYWFVLVCIFSYLLIADVTVLTSLSVSLFMF